MAALAYAHREPPSVQITVDDDSRRILVRVTGPASGPPVAGPVSRLYVERPELCAFDMLYVPLSRREREGPGRRPGG